MIAWFVFLPILVFYVWLAIMIVQKATKNRCVHRAHKLVLPCFRAKSYDGYCVKHNNKCFTACRGVWL